MRENFVKVLIDTCRFWQQIPVKYCN